MSASRWLERAVAAAVGAAAALLLVSRAPSDDEGTPGPPPPERPTSPPRLLPASEPAGDSAPPPARSPSASVARASAPTPGEPGVRRSVRVTVRTAEGAVVEEGHVYALPAGDAGTDDRWEIPNADLPDALPLDGDGPWDVGVVSGFAHALARDVTVPAGTVVDVALALPPQKPIVVRPLGPTPTIGRSEVDLLLQVTALEGARRAHPGREEALAISFGAGLRDKSWSTSPLPPGRYALVPHASFWKPGAPGADRAPVADEGLLLEVEPATAEPGDEVRLSFRQGGVLRVALRSVGQEWPAVPVSFALRLEDGARTEVREMTDDGLRLATYQPSPQVFAVVSGRARVSLSGRGVVADPLDLEVRKGERVEREMPLRFDATTSVVSPSPVEVRVEPRPDDEVLVSDGLVFGAILREDQSSLSSGSGRYLTDCVTLSEGGRLTLPPVWREVDSVVATVGDDLASDPTPVPRAGPLRVRLLPAGLVVLVPSRPFPEEAGALTVEASDRRPIGGLEGVAIAARVVAGTVLGPLPAGRYRFRVRLGRRALPDAEVDVVAGRIVPLLVGE